MTQEQINSPVPNRNENAVSEPKSASSSVNPIEALKSFTRSNRKSNKDVWYTCLFLVGLALVGVAGVTFWSIAEGSLRAFASGWLVLSGAALVGGILGLLFGIPKSISDPALAALSAREAAPSDRSGSTPATFRRTYAVNTNLEQISDWLTKIIVGVGLTQLPQLKQTFGVMASGVGASFAVGSVQPAAANVVAASIVIYGLIAGFLSGYLLTRIFLPGVLTRADALQEELNEERESNFAVGRLLGEIYSDLYLYDKQGFRDAIHKIEALLQSPSNTRNPTLWVYLAAANGQAYLWEETHGRADDPKRQQRLNEFRKAALTAVGKALELGDDWKPVLQLMWDKNHTAKSGGSGFAKAENDLEVFYDDPDFKALLGR